MIPSPATDSSVTRPTRQDIAELVVRHGFALASDNEIWWYRQHPVDGRPQAIRVVVWGVANKPNPHLGGEVVPIADERYVAERRRVLDAGQTPEMDLWRVSLRQSWPDVVAEFDRTVMPGFDA